MSESCCLEKVRIIAALLIVLSLSLIARPAYAQSDANPK